MNIPVLLLTILAICAGLANGLSSVATITATRTTAGSMDVQTSTGVYTVPAPMLTLSTAVLNAITDMLNKALTTGSATMSVPNTSQGDLMFVTVDGREYSFYVSDQLANFDAAMASISSMLYYMVQQLVSFVPV